jgi:hypothetical protein
MINMRAVPVRNFGIRVAGSGKREAKEFTLRGNLSGAGWRSSRQTRGSDERTILRQEPHHTAFCENRSRPKFSL